VHLNGKGMREWNQPKAKTFTKLPIYHAGRKKMSDESQDQQGARAGGFFFWCENRLGSGSKSLLKGEDRAEWGRDAGAAESAAGEVGWKARGGEEDWRALFQAVFRFL